MQKQNNYKKTFKSLKSLSDKVVLRTILYNLSDSDVEKFLCLLKSENFVQIDQFISRKIPDFENKVRAECRKRVNNILDNNSGE